MIKYWIYCIVGFILFFGIVGELFLGMVMMRLREWGWMLIKEDSLVNLLFCEVNGFCVIRK